MARARTQSCSKAASGMKRVTPEHPNILPASIPSTPPPAPDRRHADTGPDSRTESAPHDDLFVMKETDRAALNDTHRRRCQANGDGHHGMGKSSRPLRPSDRADRLFAGVDYQSWGRMTQVDDSCTVHRSGRSSTYPPGFRPATQKVIVLLRTFRCRCASSGDPWILRARPRLLALLRTWQSCGGFPEAIGSRQGRRRSPG